MTRAPLNIADLVEHWTLVGQEQDLVAAKHGDSKLAFALLLKFYGRFGRFPRGRVELLADAAEFVARQLKVSVGTLGSFEWAGRTIERYRAEIRQHLGFRECSVNDAEKLTDWLAGDYAQKERRYELVRDQLLSECRARSIEPPASDRVERIVRSALHQAETSLTERVASRIPADIRARLLALVRVADMADDADPNVLALIKAAPGKLKAIGQEFLLTLDSSRSSPSNVVMAHSMHQPCSVDEAADEESQAGPGSETNFASPVHGRLGIGASPNVLVAVGRGPGAERRDRHTARGGLGSDG